MAVGHLSENALLGLQLNNLLTKFYSSPAGNGEVCIFLTSDDVKAG